MELFEEPVKVGSVTRESKNTHTVNSKRLANKRLLLFLRPVALTLFLDEKKNEKKRSTHLNIHVIVICLTNIQKTKNALSLRIKPAQFCYTKYIRFDGKQIMHNSLSFVGTKSENADEDNGFTFPISNSRQAITMT